MTLIEQILYKGNNLRFYRNIDFDILMNHAKDGSDGFIFCFINNWVKEVQSYNRNNKLKSVIDSTEYSDFEWDNINNEYICIYQADGIGIEVLYETIRKKVIQENYLPKSPYLHLTEFNENGIVNKGGAWKIQVGKSDD